ncbi:MAG: hypothetical protein LBH94_02210, partial [Deltaproteobacteria bacterium]|nr:hypothetical protein [Deltaproteobacteria bacterium]
MRELLKSQVGRLRDISAMRVIAICFALVALSVIPIWAVSLSLESGSAVLIDMHSKRLLYE